MKQEHLDFIKDKAKNIMLGFTEVYGEDILISPNTDDSSLIFSAKFSIWREEFDCKLLAEVSTAAKLLKLDLPWARVRSPSIRTNTAIRIDRDKFCPWIRDNIIDADLGDIGLKFKLMIEASSSKEHLYAENAALLTYVVNEKKFPISLMDNATMAYVLYNYKMFDKIIDSKVSENMFKFKDLNINNGYIGRMIADVASIAAKKFDDWYLIQAFKESGCPLEELIGDHIGSRHLGEIVKYEDNVYPHLDMGNIKFFSCDFEFRYAQLADKKRLDFILKYGPKVSEFLVENSYGLSMDRAYRGHGAFVTGMLAARNINEHIDVFMFDDDKPYSKLLANYFLVYGFDEFSAMYHKYNYPKKEY
jgi:hypothetical protein